MSDFSEVAYPFRAAKRWWHHALFLLLATCLIALGALMQEEEPLIAFGAVGGILLFSIYQYAMTACGIVIETGSLRIDYPLHHRNLPLQEVESVAIVNVKLESGSRPEVHVRVRGERRPVKIHTFNVRVEALHRVLVITHRNVGPSRSRS